MDYINLTTAWWHTSGLILLVAVILLVVAGMFGSRDLYPDHVVNRTRIPLVVGVILVLACIAIWIINIWTLAANGFYA